MLEQAKSQTCCSARKPEQASMRKAALSNQVLANTLDTKANAFE